MIGSSNDETNFPHKVLLNNKQVSKFIEGFANGSSVNIKLSKTQLYEIGQSRRFLGRLLAPLLKNGFPLIGNLLKPLAKRILIPLGLTEGASATDVAIPKKLFGFGFTTIVSNEKMKDILKIVKSREESGLSKKNASETIKMKQNKKWRFIEMLLGTSGTSLLGYPSTSKATIRAGKNF